VKAESKVLTEIEWKQKSNIKLIIFCCYVLDFFSVLEDFQL